MTNKLVELKITFCNSGVLVNELVQNSEAKESTYYNLCFSTLAELDQYLKKIITAKEAELLLLVES